jgi:hypothetical protein
VGRLLQRQKFSDAVRQAGREKYGDFCTEEVNKRADESACPRKPNTG